MIKYLAFCITHFNEVDGKIQILTYSAIFFWGVYFLTLAKP